MYRLYKISFSNVSFAVYELKDFWVQVKVTCTETQCGHAGFQVALKRWFGTLLIEMLLSTSPFVWILYEEAEVPCASESMHREGANIKGMPNLPYFLVIIVKILCGISKQNFRWCDFSEWWVLYLISRPAYHYREVKKPMLLAVPICELIKRMRAIESLRECSWSRLRFQRIALVLAPLLSVLFHRQRQLHHGWAVWRACARHWPRRMHS